MKLILAALILLFSGPHASTFAADLDFVFSDEAKPEPPKPSRPPPRLSPTRPTTPNTPPAPVRPPPQPTPPPDEQGAGLTPPRCPECARNKNFEDLKAVVAGVSRVGDLKTWRKSRGLVQMPTEGRTHKVGPCQTTHYLPFDGTGSDAQGFPKDNYATPTLACSMLSVMQDWKKYHCPQSDQGCRLAWGDISHRDARKFNGHHTHTDGNCIDIRPPRKGEFEDAGLTYNDSAYDLKKTREFIDLVRQKGADLILFNDNRIKGIGRAGGHDNHIHVCFKPGPKTRAACENFQYDPAVCEGD